MTQKKLAWIRKLECCMPHVQCTDTEAAHVRTAVNSGTGCKPDDKYTIPLCSACHAIQHQHGHQHLLEERYRDSSFDKHSAKDFLMVLANEYEKMFKNQYSYGRKSD